jgi:hypothetical protein
MRTLAITAVVAVAASSTVRAAIEIDARYPGGNIIVERIDGDVVYLRPDQRDTTTWWFYWNFRVRGVAGRSLRFVFQGPSPIGVYGPALSLDCGNTWSWLGREAVDEQAEDASFHYSFPSDSREVRFSFAFPYQESHLESFLAAHAHALLRIEKLCQTPGGRTVEMLRIGDVTRKDRTCVLLTARHHACETMASYTLEGLLESILKDDELGRSLRARGDFLAIPFVDKDGVELGDQGKNRAPHDHWLDYEGTSRYAAVAALRELAPQWLQGRRLMALDFHCPSIREASDVAGSSERIFFMNSQDEAVAGEAERFQAMLERVQRGPLQYRRRHDLPFGARWNTAEIAAPSFLGWASRLPNIGAAAVIEIPYANVDSVPVTAESARLLGRDLAVAMHKYLLNASEN